MAQGIVGVGDGTAKLANGASGKVTANGKRSSVPPAAAAAPAVKPARKAAGKAAGKKSAARGLGFERRFSQRNVDPLDQVTWERRTSVITNPDGSIVFKMDGAEIPAGWSQLATDIVVSKYFRKAGLHGKKELGETSVRQVVHRLARTIREAGERFGGYFASAKEADTFEAELSFLLVNQYGAFNSPVWFNCGLFHRYEITGTGGNYAWRMNAAPNAPDEIFETDERLRAPAVLGVLHPGHPGRPDEHLRPGQDPRRGSSSTARARGPTSAPSAASRRSSRAAAPAPG